MKHRTAALKNLPRQYRTLDLELVKLDRAAGAAEDEPATYEMSVSSEAKIPRWYGLEVLSHEKSAVDLRYMRKNGALLVEHGGEVVGVVLESWLDEGTRKLRAKIRFSRSVRGREIEQDVNDGIRTRVSTGYVIQKAKLTVQGETMAEDEWLITRWMPVEYSLVGIPADLSVGVGRSAETGESFAVEIEGGASAEEERSMKCKLCGQETCAHSPAERAGSETVETRSGAPAASAQTPAQPAAVETRGGTAAPSATIEGGATRDIAEIADLCQSHGMSDRIADYVRRKLTYDQVATDILKLKTSRAIAQPPSERAVELSDKDASNYSYRKAILESVSRGGITGLEREVSDEIEKKLPGEYKRRGGFFVPTRLQTPTEQRTMAGNVAGAGPELVQAIRGEFVELLRNATVLAGMGATIVSDLTGNFELVKQTAGSTATWVGENPPSDVGDSQAILGILGAVPKTLMANTPFTRQLLVQSSAEVERIVKNDMAEAHGLAFDYAGLYGRGTNAEPQGIYNAPDVQVAVMGGQPDWAKLVNMSALPAAKNAQMGNLGWVTHPTLAAVMMGKPRIAGAAGGWLWEGSVGEGQIAGYKARSTNQVSATMSGSAPTGGSQVGLVFGNWADLFFLSWAAMELIVDELSQKKKAVIEVTSFQMVDILLRRGESFAKTVDATL
jgi:HK97 family phage major capsid protein